MKAKSDTKFGYEKVKYEIEQMIHKGELSRGCPVPSERLLAEQLSASIGEVRLAVNRLAGEGKLVRIARKGTFVSKELPSDNPVNMGGRQAWAVLVRDLQYFYPPIVETIEREARKRGITILLGCVGSDLDVERQMVEQKIAEGVSGIILAPAMPKDLTSTASIPPDLPRPEGSLGYLAELSVPVVVIDHFGMDIPSLGVDCVIKDDFAGVYLSTVHMIRHGYKKVAGFFGISPDQKIESYEYSKRGLGFKAAVRDYDMPLPELPELCSWDIDYNPDAIKRYLDAGYNAFVLGNDNSAALLVRLLDRWGVKVPDDAALIGFDDDRICTMTNPPLSSVSISKEEMGQKAVAMLAERIESRQRGDYRSIILKPTVIGRTSCGCKSSVADNAKPIIPTKSSSLIRNEKTIQVG